MMAPVVFLLDVDNTLLDSDRVVADLMRHLERAVGHEYQQQYWEIFDQLRAELGYADYLGALQRYRVENPRDPNVLNVSSFLINYPFANRLFPDSLEVIERLNAWGPTVILTDGDVVFQPRKIERSGTRTSSSATLRRTSACRESATFSTTPSIASSGRDGSRQGRRPSQGRRLVTGAPARGLKPPTCAGSCNMRTRRAGIRYLQAFLVRATDGIPAATAIRRGNSAGGGSHAERDPDRHGQSDRTHLRDPCH